MLDLLLAKIKKFFYKLNLTFFYKNFTGFQVLLIFLGEIYDHT